MKLKDDLVAELIGHAPTGFSLFHVLAEREPYALWTSGESSLLARPLADMVTITGSRAATSYGEKAAAELAWT